MDKKLILSIGSLEQKPESDEEKTHAINIILTERYLELGPQISEVDDQEEIL